jgi:hypothetical protein
MLLHANKQVKSPRSEPSLGRDGYQACYIQCRCTHIVHEGARPSGLCLDSHVMVVDLSCTDVPSHLQTSFSDGSSNTLQSVGWCQMRARCLILGELANDTKPH